MHTLYCADGKPSINAMARIRQLRRRIMLWQTLLIFYLSPTPFFPLSLKRTRWILGTKFELSSSSSLSPFPVLVKNDSREGEETATKGPSSSGSPSPSSFASVESAFPVGSRREVEISSLLQENK